MASSVFWKFKSQKDESRVTFDGTSISVFDLKKEIILANNLVSSASDFDLQILDSTTEQEYKDDNHQIARSTSVLAKRLPASRPGKGKAASYVVGIQPGTSRPDSSASNPTNTWQHGATMSKRFDGREDSVPKKPDDPPQFTSETTSAEEAASIAAMFQASQEVWDETQEKMAQFVFIPIYLSVPSSYANPLCPFNQGNRGAGDAGSSGGFQRNQESRPVPLGYICYRCGKKGHWIHDCPTNDDREWDNRPRVKRTTGIPRSFLKTVEQPNDGPLGQGVMVTPDGGFVVAQPDIAAWQKQRARPKALTSAEIYAAPAPSTHSNLACPICDRLTKNAVRTPCCRMTYCEECIQTYLLEHDFVCRCGKKIASLDRLEADEKRREQVGEVVRSMIEESRKESMKQEPAEEPTAIPSTSSNPITAASVPAEKPTSTPPPNPSTPNQDSSQQDLASLQAQLAQLSQMLTNPGLPQVARQQAQRQAAKINAEMQKIMTGGGQMGGGGPQMGMGMPMGGGPGMGGPGMGGPGMGMGQMGMPMGMPMNGGGMMGNGMGMNMGMGNGMGMGMGMGMNNMGGMGMMNGMGMGMNPMMQNQRMMGMNMNMGGPMMGPGPNMNMGFNPMMGAGGGQNWTNPFANQQPAGNESAYQRLPVHNRRKKRDRPSDFVEVGGDQSKMPRYWE
ncbi:mRNA polyadenylation-like protein [Ceratobasidium sp. AG-Ba]|nr:mRNA polyadenylation-like protein [Ceratobasidium sp. AG-Ba]